MFEKTIFADRFLLENREKILQNKKKFENLKK